MALHSLSPEIPVVAEPEGGEADINQNDSPASPLWTWFPVWISKVTP